MWGSTASLTSWSASQSLRASASTFSVWVSGLPAEEGDETSWSQCSAAQATYQAAAGGGGVAGGGVAGRSQAEGDLWSRL